MALVLTRYLLYNIVMRVRIFKGITVLLSALMLMASAQMSFAGGKKLPKLKKVKVNSSVLPKGPTVPVVRPVVAQVRPLASAVERAVTAQVAAQTAPRVALSAHLQKDFLTGPQALASYIPGWKSELRSNVFTEEQLQVIEQTFKQTDKQLFKLDEDGNWLAPAENSTEWEYERWFAMILDESPVKFSEAQLKTLFGQKARFEDVFTRLNYQAFLLVNKRAPKINTSGEERKLARHANYLLKTRDGRKMNPEAEGYVYGDMPAKLKTPKPSYGHKGQSARRTPEEVLAQVKAFIKETGRFPLQHVADETERSLRHAFYKASTKAEARGLTDDTSRELLALKEQWVNKIADKRTPEEVFTQVKEFIKQNGRFPLQYSGDKKEDSLRQAFDKACKKAENKSDETSQKLISLKEQWVKQYAGDRTPQEVLTQVEIFVKQYGRFPALHAEDETESSLRHAFDRASDKAKAQGLADPISKELLALKDRWIREIKTPQEWLNIMEKWVTQHGRWPSYHIEEERQVYQGSYKAMWNNPNDPASIKLKELHEKYK